jgi:transcriptional regulator with XRE-family HTH domain
MDNDSSTMKHRTFEGFGPRLAQIRKSKGLTQAQLGAKLGISFRVVSYYEEDNAQPPGALLIDLARVLNVSADELLGLKQTKEKTDPEAALLLRRVRKIQKLSKGDQRAVFKFIDALLARRVAMAPRTAAGKKNTKEALPLRKAAGGKR